MRRISFIKSLVLVSVFVFSYGSGQAQTSVFTYQGKLTDMSAAANGQYDFTFKLFDAAAGGMQIGIDAVRDDVVVTGGIFTATLDFGANAFSNGAPRFLEISVRPGASTGAFSPLTPRQEITSAPFSIKSLNAANAANADGLSSACLLCVTNAQIGSIDGSKVTGTVANAANATNAATAVTAGSVTGIVQIANGGTGSATKNFIDLSTNQTNISGDKTFTGVLSGNGAGLTNIPGTVKWQSVTGPAQQAQPNNGYFTINNTQLTVTLPATPNIGDVVRVSALGAGGWKIAQNAGQSIIGKEFGLFGLSWVPRESPRGWRSIASSADGVKLAAVEGPGQIFTSTDSGVTWTPRESNRFWFSVASSADGSKFVAVVLGGQIYTSTDSGVSWTPRDSSRDWQAVTSSADGRRLLAVVFNGPIYISADSGVTWAPKESSRIWTAVASSADGNITAATGLGEYLYISGASTSIGTNGSLSGGQYTAIELLYIGDGQFFPISYVGAISGN